MLLKIAVRHWVQILAVASLFLSAKVAENPKRLSHFIKLHCSFLCLKHKEIPDVLVGLSQELFAPMLEKKEIPEAVRFEFVEDLWCLFFTFCVFVPQVCVC